MKQLAILIFLSCSVIYGQNQKKVNLYSNGDTSVVIGEWINNKRIIQLFDLQGNKTFEVEGIRLSYTVLNKLKFRENGSVKEIIQSSNPGASRYSYRTTILFDTTNIPLRKQTEKIPSDLQDLEQTKVWLWSTKKKKWILQTSVECQSYPGK